MSKKTSDAQFTIGKIIKGDAKRDAVHFAVIPMVAGVDLTPGIPVSVDPDDKKTYPHAGDGAIGIVDPFLKQYVRAGQRFWLFLMPNTITTLRHVWEHPAFSNEPPPDDVAIPASLPPATSSDDLYGSWGAPEASPPADPPEPKPDGPSKSERIYAEHWLRRFAFDVDADYNEMIGVALTHCDDRRWGDYLSEGGKWEGQVTPVEFWDHLKTLTGKEPKDGPTEIFSCSC